MRAGQQLSELESQIQRVVKEYPKQGQPPINFSVNTVKETFIDARRRERLLLFALNGGGIVLLLVGTWNATGFLLLSALARRRDFQIRVALGASRSQLIAAVLREPTTVFVAATVLAWPVAAVVSLGLSDFLPTAGGQRQLSLAMFVILWGLVCFGVAAAVCTTAVRRQIKTVAIAGGWSTTRRTRLETVLLLSAIAVPCAALIAGVSFGRTLQNLISGLGYDPDSLLVVSVDSQRSKFALDDDVQAYRSQLAAELTSRFPNSPVALASLGPLDYSGPRQFIMVRSRPSERPQLTSISFVSDSYFQVVGSNLVSGRAPQAGGPEMEAVIDLDSQRALFGENNALGACVYLMSSQRCVRVVGVSPVRRARMLKQSTSELFVPVADASSYGLGTIGRTLLVRVNAGDRHAIASHVQGDREVPVQIVEAAELVSAQSGPWRIGLRSLSTLGLVALLLSVIGVAASVALEVRSKMSEIWIRLVLGARQSGVVWLLLRRVLIANTVGIVSGVGVALLLIELVQSRVVNVADAAIAPVVFVSATVAIATLIGALVPAVGAARMKVNSAIGRQN